MSSLQKGKQGQQSVECLLFNVTEKKMVSRGYVSPLVAAVTLYVQIAPAPRLISIINK